MQSYDRVFLLCSMCILYTTNSLDDHLCISLHHQRHSLCPSSRLLLCLPPFLHSPRPHAPDLLRGGVLTLSISFFQHISSAFRTDGSTHVSPFGPLYAPTPKLIFAPSVEFLYASEIPRMGSAGPNGTCANVDMLFVAEKEVVVEEREEKEARKREVRNKFRSWDIGLGVGDGFGEWGGLERGSGW